MAATMLQTSAGKPNTSFDYQVISDRFFALSVRRLAKESEPPFVVACRFGPELSDPVRHFFLEDAKRFGAEIVRYINPASLADLAAVRARVESVLTCIAQTIRVVGRLVDRPSMCYSESIVKEGENGVLTGSGTFSCSLMLDGSTTFIFPKKPDTTGKIVAGDLNACIIPWLDPFWAQMEAEEKRLSEFQQPVGFKRKAADGRDLRAYDLLEKIRSPTPFSVVLLMGYTATLPAAAAHAEVKITLDPRVVMGSADKTYERMLNFMRENRINFPRVPDTHTRKFIATDAPMEPFAQFVALPFFMTVARAVVDVANDSVVVQALSSDSKPSFWPGNIVTEGHMTKTFDISTLVRKKFHLLRPDLKDRRMLKDVDAFDTVNRGGNDTGSVALANWLRLPAQVAQNRDMFDPETTAANVRAFMDALV